MASFYKQAGGDATELLDHSSSKVTKVSYLDPRIVIAQHAADLLPAVTAAPLNERTGNMPLSVLLDDYCHHMQSASDAAQNAKYARCKRDRAARLFDTCGFSIVRDLDAGKVLTKCDRQTAAWSAAAVFSRMEAAYAFAGWLADEHPHEAVGVFIHSLRVAYGAGYRAGARYKCRNGKAATP